MEKNYKYVAFISYRHKPLDISVSKELHKLLESYKIPKTLRRENRKRLGKVFRDNEELPTSSNLANDIVEALENSEWLIVVCTPDTPKSEWCRAEIETFIKLRGRKRILTLLAAGEPSESFPEPLLFEKMEDGSIVKQEPLAANVRAKNILAAKFKLRKEKLRLIAPMLDIGYSVLFDREKDRFRRMVIRISLLCAVFFATFGGYAANQAMTISRQNKEIVQTNLELVEQRNVAEENAAEAKLQADIARENQLLAEKNETEAIKQQGIAEINQQLAEDNAKEAQTQKEIALINEAEANTQRNIARENEMEAKAQRNELAAKQAEIYANLSAQLLEEGNVAGAGILALESMEYDLSGSSSETRLSLYQSAYWENRIKWTINMTANNPQYKSTICVQGYNHFIEPYIAFNNYMTVAAIAEGAMVRFYDIKTHKLLTSIIGLRNDRKVFEKTINGVNYSQHCGVLTPNKDGSSILIPAELPKIADANTGELLYEGMLTEEMFVDFGLERFQFNSDPDSLTDILTGKEMLIDDSVDTYSNIYFSADGRYTAAIADKNRLLIYDMTNFNTVVTFGKEEQPEIQDIKMFTFSPDSRYILFVWDDFHYNYDFAEKLTRHVTVYDLEELALISEYTYIDTPHTSLLAFQNSGDNAGFKCENLFSPDGSKVFLPKPSMPETTEPELGLFNLDTATFYDKHLLNMRVLSFNQGGSHALLADEGGIYLLGIESNVYFKAREPVEGCFCQFAYITDDCQYILAKHTKLDNKVSLEFSRWHFYELMPNIELLNKIDEAAAEGLLSIIGNNSLDYEFDRNAPLTMQAKDTTISDDASTLCTIEGSTIKVFDANTGAQLTEITFEKKISLSIIDVTAQRLWVYSDGCFECYNTRDGSLIWSVPQNSSFMLKALVSPDKKLLDWLTGEGDFIVLDAQTGQEISRKFHKALVKKYNTACFFTNDSKYFFIESLNLLLYAKTGEITAFGLEPPLPYWMQPDSSELTYINDTFALRIPPIDEVVTKIKNNIREFDFTEDEKHKYFVD